MLTWKCRPGAALVGVPFGAPTQRPRDPPRRWRPLISSFLTRIYGAGIKELDMQVRRLADRVAALSEGERRCSEADFRAVPVGAAPGLADRALVARASADLDLAGPVLAVPAGAARAAPADTGSVDATSGW